MGEQQQQQIEQQQQKIQQLKQKQIEQQQQQYQQQIEQQQQQYQQQIEQQKQKTESSQNSQLFNQELPELEMRKKQSKILEVNSFKEVFNIRENIYSYDEAHNVCKSLNAELASLDQLVMSYKKGANWCNYGWSKDQLALYPIQKEYWNELVTNYGKEYQCGYPGI